jgi:ribosomal protein S25
VPRLAAALGVSRQGAQYVIRSLERAGIIDEVVTDARPTLYVARSVLDVLQAD